MSNIQVTHDTNPNNARSESAIVINPNNPQQMVAASKRFNNIQTYDFTLATVYSTDGGNTWHDSAAFALPAGATVMTDPTLAWDDAGNVYSLGLAGNNPPTFNTIGMVNYKSIDGGQTWSAPNLIHTSAGDDKQWMAGDTNPASPFHGHVYAVWDDGSTMRFARTLDGGATWIGTGASTVSATSLTNDSFSPEINVASNGDIYIVWLAGNSVKMLKSTDGGNSFIPTAFPATGITLLESGLPSVHGWHVFSGANFRVVTTPTACVLWQTVVVAWDDFREGTSRVYYNFSTNGGTSWNAGPSGQPLLTGSIPANMQHFFPQMIADPNGVIGCSFYELGPKPTNLLIDVMMAQSFDGGASFNAYTVTDQPWNPTVDAPWAHHGDGTAIDASVTFIGDYFGIDASPRGFYPLWTDTRTGIQELFTAIVPEKKCMILMNRSTLGEDEIAARRTQPPNTPGGLPVPDAFRVIMDGFTASELGINNTGGNLPVLPVASPGNGLTIRADGNNSTSGSYGPEAQRFTFFFNLDFSGNRAFGFGGDTKMVMISMNIFHQVAAAELELIKQPNPFILHGDPSWLSIDLRVFVVRQGELKFGVPGVSGPSDAPRFIRDVMGAMTNMKYDSLSTREEQSKLYVQPVDEYGAPVYNFALAKVHYIGLIGASNVRMFFRMFQAQTTSAEFDPSTTYRRWPVNPAGQPIALPGIRGNEYATIPFFANDRVDSTTTSLVQQTDPANVKSIAAIGGPEVDTYFGCWLDINQPFKPSGFLVANRVLPMTVPASQVNGPFTDPSNPALTIQQSILRNLHQCLIAEIAFDLVSIPIGKNPSNWDKLAQRNIAWSDVGSVQGVTTFEIKPTMLTLPAGAVADELMIDWGQLPKGCLASIYLPAVPADMILSMASRMYTFSKFTRIDTHTLQCPAEGITYLPIPPGTAVDFPGLLSIDMPGNLPPRQVYNVVVRQVTHASMRGKLLKGDGRSNKALATSAKTALFQYRKVSGAFQLTIPVHNKVELLLREERDLSVLRWIGESLPFHHRWYAVFQRYLKTIGDRVIVFGGNPSHIFPSPTGDGKQHPHPGHPGHPGVHEEMLDFTGKISRLLFDQFGDFDGFILRTKHSEQKFYSRETEVETFVARAWRERLRITVHVREEEPNHPMAFIVNEPPASF